MTFRPRARVIRPESLRVVPLLEMAFLGISRLSRPRPAHRVSTGPSGSATTLFSRRARARSPGARHSSRRHAARARDDREAGRGGAPAARLALAARGRRRHRAAFAAPGTAAVGAHGQGVRVRLGQAHAGEPAAQAEDGGEQAAAAGRVGVGLVEGALRSPGAWRRCAATGELSGTAPRGCKAGSTGSRRRRPPREVPELSTYGANSFQGNLWCSIETTHLAC